MGNGSRLLFLSSSPREEEEGQLTGLGTQGSPCPCPGTSSGPKGNSKQGKHGEAGESHTSPSRGAASFICLYSSLHLVRLVGPRAMAPGPLLSQGSFPSFSHHGSLHYGFLGPLSPDLISVEPGAFVLKGLWALLGVSLRPANWSGWTLSASLESDRT